MQIERATSLDVPENESPRNSGGELKAKLCLLERVNEYHLSVTDTSLPINITTKSLESLRRNGNADFEANDEKGRRVKYYPVRIYSNDEEIHLSGEDCCIELTIK